VRPAGVPRRQKASRQWTSGAVKEHLMISFRFNHVRVESFGLHFPTTLLSSAEIEERIAPAYERLKIPAGTLERVSGVSTRGMWSTDVTPSSVATVAAREALDRSGFRPEQIGALINCSVSRDFFEPATACLVHHNLGIPEESLVLDITNACIGFSDGMIMLAHLIEAGTVKAGIICSGENISKVVHTTCEQLLGDLRITRDKLLQMLPTLTLGCGAVAAVLCHDSIATSGHRFVGGVARSASQHHQLCIGNGDFSVGQGEEIAPIMTSDAAQLMIAAAKLGGRAFPDVTAALGWSKDHVDHVFCHQVGRQVNDAFYREMGLDFEKDFAIYKRYGNMVSAALPAALAIGADEKDIQPGEKVLLTAFGSGLNTRFLGFEW
jgi:3-oxoacyl-[acyl-carrier-protein] synthase-3